MAHIANKPSLITHGCLRFLIIDAPNDNNVDAYIREFRSNNVTDVDFPFTDGVPPPPDVIEKFLTLCSQRFAKGNPGGNTISVHCVAGLGRAPVLVALALMREGLDPLAAVELIRAKRRGAINTRQLHFLEHEYRPSRPKACCVIM